jgi:hypothetical protein
MNYEQQHAKIQQLIRDIEIAGTIQRRFPMLCKATTAYFPALDGNASARRWYAENESTLTTEQKWQYVNELRGYQEYMRLIAIPAPVPAVTEERDDDR